ncbi:glutamate ABC transporter substrate-binding protein [Corynebacterium riegelii]|uniref:glutamate ABC transporter substrate-binding protein n=1 Tax=Corynebacterium riegelii TaxID=156976 RepID=UPI00254C3A7A|nr:glutamate ABC transporter substrate-binding protein [Corynebacterium riegelii]MDK7181535.1 glutamate ABC transporter substrate-binding protein [Corynebacterium riegelii]
MKRRLVISACAAACTAVALVATACTSPPPPPAGDPPLSTREPLRPPGAILDPPGVAPEGEYASTPEEWGWPGSLPPGTEEQRDGPNMQRIRERGRVLVGVDQSQYLLSYRDPSAGEMRGFEVDLAREIARDIFGSADHVEFRFVESASRAEALRSGDVDIVIRTMSVTPDRAEIVSFSTPYLTSYVRMLAPRDSDVASLDDLPGKTVCAVDGTNLLNLVREKVPESEVLRTRSWSDCLMALQQYQADAVIGDDTLLAGMVAQDPLMQIFPERLAEQRYAVGVGLGNDDVVRQVNFTIERLRSDGTWTRMYNQWLRTSLAESWLPRQMYAKEDEAQ